MKIQLKMDDELHRRFKMFCAGRRSNMTAEINWLITRELEILEKATKKDQEQAERFVKAARSRKKK